MKPHLLLIEPQAEPLKIGHLSDQSGIGLVELLVSMFIGLFIMAGVVQMVGTTSQNAVSNNGIARIQENTRYAFSRIEDDLMRAGHMGCVSTSVSYQAAEYNYSGEDLRAIDSSTMVDSLLQQDNGRNERHDYLNLIGGHDNINDATLGAGGTDSFIVRLVDQSVRAKVKSMEPDEGSLELEDNTFADTENIKEDQVVTIASCERSVSLMIATASGAEVTWGTAIATGSVNQGQSNSGVATGIKVEDKPAGEKAKESPTYLYAGGTGAYRYYIDTSAFGVQNGGTCNTTTGKKFCALFRVSDGVGEELVDGVHDMQIEYGVTTEDAAGVLSFRFLTASNINALTVGSGNAIEDSLLVDRTWNSVDRVRITLSMNSVEAVTTTGNTNNGQPLEQDFTRTISLFNQL